MFLFNSHLRGAVPKVISGLTKEEAIAKVNADVKLQELTLIYGKYKFSKEFDEIGFKYSVDKAVNEAFSVAKGINFFENVNTLIKLNMGDRKDIRLSYEYNEKLLDKFITKISKKALLYQQISLYQIQASTVLQIILLKI